MQPSEIGVRSRAGWFQRVFFSLFGVFASSRPAQVMIDSPAKLEETRGKLAALKGRIRAALADHLPAANNRMRMAKTCLYTMTPDGHFLIDRVISPHIILVSACSGPRWANRSATARAACCSAFGYWPSSS